MSVIVCSCGRSGTNVVLEILRGNPALVASKVIEDKKFFIRDIVYDANYLTKCDLVYCNKKQITSCLKRNPKLQIVWPIRDCRDMIMSKIRRGQPKSAGGDIKKLSEDATSVGCLVNITRMFEMYKFVLERWPARVILVKMEDVLESPEQSARQLCKFLELPYTAEMLNFVARMRMATKRARYKTIDKGEIAKWKHWEAAYDGFFKAHNYNLPQLFNEVKYINDYFGY